MTMDRAAFFKSLRRRDSGAFGTSLSQGQVRGTDGILDAFEQVGNGERTTLAYALATAYHETGGRMVPVREGFASTDAGARSAVNNLARRRGPGSSVARYAQPQPPHGHVYYGRGHVQLTWLDNYRRSSADAGVDLVANPDAMLDPVISARVLILGLIDGRWNGRGHGIEHYEDQDGLPGLSEVEAIAARRTVNVQDKASQIAAYYRAFDAALVAGGMPQVSDIIPARPATPQEPPTGGQVAPPRTSGLLAALAALLARFFGSKVRQGDPKTRGLVPVSHGERTIWVDPDFHVEGGIRMPVNLTNALAIAEERSREEGRKMQLPTRGMVDSIHAAADVRLVMPVRSHDRQALATYRSTSEEIDRALDGRTGLISGHKKEILRPRSSTDNRLTIYGGMKRDGTFWQSNPSRVHSAEYADYSSGLRLIYDPEESP